MIPKRGFRGITKVNRPALWGCSNLNRSVDYLNPFHAKATFVYGRKMRKLLKTIQTLSCWYSLESSRRVLSDEYPFVRVSVLFSVFWHNFVLTKSATSSIRIKGSHSTANSYSHLYLTINSTFTIFLEIFAHYSRLCQLKMTFIN